MKRKAKKETAEQRAARERRNMKARERHWRRTGVSQATVEWMRERNWL